MRIFLSSEKDYRKAWRYAPVSYNQLSENNKLIVMINILKS